MVERVDAHPKMKRRLNEWYYTYAAITTFNRKYLVRPPHVKVQVAGTELRGVTVVVQNCDPYTYFSRRPIRINDGAALDDGLLGVTVLRRATPLELPTVLWRAFSGKAATVANHRQIDGFPGVEGALVSALDDRPFPCRWTGTSSASSIRFSTRWRETRSLPWAEPHVHSGSCRPALASRGSAASSAAPRRRWQEPRRSRRSSLPRNR